MRSNSTYQIYEVKNMATQKLAVEDQIVELRAVFMKRNKLDNAYEKVMGKSCRDKEGFYRFHQTKITLGQLIQIYKLANKNRKFTGW